MLEVDGSPNTGAAFQSVRARLEDMPSAPTSEQVARAQEGQQRGSVATGGGNVQVAPPSGQWRTYRPGNFLRVSVPANWQQIAGGNTVTYAPEGGYYRGQGGQSSFTHGIEIGVMQGDGGTLQQSTEQLLKSFARSNPRLRRQGGYSRANIGGRQGLTTTLSNVSDVTGETEAVNVSTLQLRDGSILFVIGVAPADEARRYLNTFGRVRQSLQITEGAQR
jgi:hypothetical protein